MRAHRAWGNGGGQGGGYQDSGRGATAGDQCRGGATAAAGVGAQDRGGGGLVGGGAEDRGADGEEAKEGQGDGVMSGSCPRIAQCSWAFRRRGPADPAVRPALHLGAHAVSPAHEIPRPLRERGGG